MTSALTPALSPKRGGIVRRVFSNAIRRVGVRLSVNGMESVMATKIEKLSGNVTVRSLSPGERAGVRASVNSNFTENVVKPHYAVQSSRDVSCLSNLKIHHGGLVLFV